MTTFRRLMILTALVALPVSIAAAPRASAIPDIYFAIVYSVAALAGIGYIVHEAVSEYLFWRQPAPPREITPNRSATEEKAA